MENEDNGVMIDPTNERAKAVEVSKSPPEEHHAPHQGTMRSSREGLLASYLQPSEANGSVIGIAACGNRRICLIRLSSLVSWLIINIFFIQLLVRCELRTNVDVMFSCRMENPTTHRRPVDDGGYVFSVRAAAGWREFTSSHSMMWSHIFLIIRLSYLLKDIRFKLNACLYSSVSRAGCKSTSVQNPFILFGTWVN